jgi:hypothetical protein
MLTPMKLTMPDTRKVRVEILRSGDFGTEVMFLDSFTLHTGTYYISEPYQDKNGKTYVNVSKAEA